MTRYLEGILLLAVAFVPLQTGSFLWRARLMGDWRGGRARLVEIVMDVTVLILVSEILGSLDLYRVAPVVIALALVGVAAIWTARRPPSMSSEEPVPLPTPEERTEPRAGKIAALIVVSVVLAEWSTQTVSAYHHGMLSTDTLWYHMPFAARFVQDHSVTAIHYFDSGVTAFYPASSELVHAFGILTMGNDVLSPLLNTLWLGVALLASWCIGRPFGVGSVTLTGSAILFGTPGLVATQPGGAYDDVVGLAFMLSAVALLVNAQVLSERSQRTAWIMAAASSGLALGTKWTFIGPVAALTIGVWFVVAREKRIRSWGIWLVALLLTGGFWYGRNLIAVGNPIPPFHLKIGPLSLPSPQVTTPSSTVAHFLFNTTDWRNILHPGAPTRLWTGMVGAPWSLRPGPRARSRQRGSPATSPRFGGSRIGSHLPLYSAIPRCLRCACALCRPGPVHRCSRDPRSRPAADQSDALDLGPGPMDLSCLWGGSRGHSIRCRDLADNVLHAAFRRRPCSWN